MCLLVLFSICLFVTINMKMVPNVETSYEETLLYYWLLHICSVQEDNVMHVQNCLRLSIGGFWEYIPSLTPLAVLLIL